MRIGARTEILLDLDINPILVRVYKDESLPMELVFGDHDAPPFRGEIAFDAVFTLKVNEAAFLVQIGAQLAGQSLSIGELEPATELAFELAIKRGLLVLEPSCPACGPEHSPLALTDFTNTYLTALIVLVPDIFEYMEPRVIEAAAENWHDALRMLMRPLRARQVWPMFEDATTTELVTSFLSMVGSEGYFTRDLPLSHIDALRHYSFEWALWRNRLGLSQAGKRIAFPCASCGALGQCAPTCTAAPALRNGFRRAAAVAAAGPGGSAPVVVEIRVVAPEPLPPGPGRPSPSLDISQTKSAVSDACEFLGVRCAAELPAPIRALVPLPSQCDARGCGDVGYFACQGCRPAAVASGTMSAAVAAGAGGSSGIKRYCSLNCQKEDWRAGHRASCAGNKKAAQASGAC